MIRTCMCQNYLCYLTINICKHYYERSANHSLNSYLTALSSIRNDCGILFVYSDSKKGLGKHILQVLDTHALTLYVHSRMCQHHTTR